MSKRKQEEFDFVTRGYTKRLASLAFGLTDMLLHGEVPEVFPRLLGNMRELAWHWQRRCCDDHPIQAKYRVETEEGDTLILFRCGPHGGCFNKKGKITSVDGFKVLEWWKRPGKDPKVMQERVLQYFLDYLKDGESPTAAEIVVNLVCQDRHGQGLWGRILEKPWIVRGSARLEEGLVGIESNPGPEYPNTELANSIAIQERDFSPHIPGYCYLVLFKQKYWNQYKWPAYPQLAEIAQYELHLREKSVNITARRTLGRNCCVHIQRSFRGSNGWNQINRWIIEGRGHYEIGAFRWTAQMAAGLRDFLIGYQHVMPLPVPTPIAPTGANQDAVAQREQEIADMEDGRMMTVNGFGQLLTNVLDEWQRTHPPSTPSPLTKAEMPDHFEGDPSQVDNWLRTMEVYFTLARETTVRRRIVICLYRTRKGKGNRAGEWAGVKLQEIQKADEEYERRNAQSPTRYPKDLTWAEMNNGRRDPLQPEDNVLLWTRPPNHNKYPWTTWGAFKTEMHEFFMSTETKQHATDDLMKLEQRNTPIEDYIIKFNALSPLVGWGEAALKDHFLNRINPALGGELIRHGNLADDATSETDPGSGSAIGTSISKG